MIYYSKARGGFFDSAVHDVLPDDVVEISAELHRDLLDSQSQGMVIVGDDQGVPSAVDPRSLFTLDQAKAARWQDVKQNRDRRIDGGCDVPGMGRFQTDMLSRSNINGAVTGAFMAKSAAAPFAVNWTLADNSVVELDADQMILVGQVVLAHVSACHAHSQALSLVIAAAETTADLDGIDIEQGWPA